MISSRGQIRLWAVVYAVVGVLVCVMNVSAAAPPDVPRFLVYRVCAHATALALRVTTGQSLIPGAFLIVLLGIEDLSLPELLFIGFTLAFFNELRQASRRVQWTRLMYATT